MTHIIGVIWGSLVNLTTSWMPDGDFSVHDRGIIRKNKKLARSICSGNLYDQNLKWFDKGGRLSAWMSTDRKALHLKNPHESSPIFTHVVFTFIASCQYMVYCRSSYTKNVITHNQAGILTTTVPGFEAPQPITNSWRTSNETRSASRILTVCSRSFSCRHVSFVTASVVRWFP